MFHYNCGVFCLIVMYDCDNCYMRFCVYEVGASEVFVFDHTIRDSQTKSLNAPKGHTAGYAQRVHC